MFPFKLKSPLTAREWLLIIFSIALVELIFLHFVYTNGRNEGMFNYFSFAATLASIILAVIAIIYGFIQSLSQQSATDRLTHGVDALDQVVLEIQTSKTGLAGELSKIGTVTEKIDAILGEVTASRGELSEKLGAIGASLKQAKPKEETPTQPLDTTTKEQETKPVFQRMNNATAICAIALYLARSHPLTDQEIFNNYLWPSYCDAAYKPGDKPTPGMEKFLEGWYFAVLRMLNALAWLSINNKEKKISLDPHFEKAAAKFISSGISFEEPFTTFYNALTKRFAQPPKPEQVRPATP